MPGVFSMNLGSTPIMWVMSARSLYFIRSSMMSWESTLINSGESCELIISRLILVAG